MTQATASAPATVPRFPVEARDRVASVDLIRGIVMILMAIDHVRVYAGVPAGGPTPGLFFTRWVTHFCAPAFVFLAGTSAFLYGRRHDDLPRFLLTRGAWLVLLEMTYLRVAWTFNLDFAGYELAGVIWVIGWCMILMAGLVNLPPAVIAAVGVIVIAGHNVMDSLVPLSRSLAQSALSGIWKIVYLGFYAGPVEMGPNGPRLMVLYSIVPWIGVMAAGWAFGCVIALPAQRRDRLCLAVGLGAVALFLLLRGLDLYGDPRPWRAQTAGAGAPPMPALLAFLNTTKYPASLCFLLMTLGPAIAAIPLLERARGAAARWVALFGRVPFFYYMLHIPLIHLLAIAVCAIRLGDVSPWLFANHPMGNPPPPDGYAWSLPLLYGVWAAAILILYPACAWFAHLKAKRRSRWLSYL